MMVSMTRMSFGPRDDEQYATVRAALVADFDQWVRRLPLMVDVNDFELLLDWKRSYGDSRLTCGSARTWRSSCSTGARPSSPRRRRMPHGLPSTVALSMSFLADRHLLARGSDPVDRLTEYAVSLQQDFMTEMADPANFGMAKSLFASMNLDPARLTGPTLDQAVRTSTIRPTSPGGRSWTTGALRHPTRCGSAR